MSHRPFLPLLVTGIAGVAGYNAFRHFSAKYPGQVIGARRADNWKLSGDGIVACDSDDTEGWQRLFAKHRFKAVLNSEGSCKLKSCELDPAMAWRVNLESVRNLVQLAQANGARFLHLSIDLVFSGIGDGEYVESDRPDPVTVYGTTMVAAEHLVQATLPEACILRISLPMGVSFNGHAGAIDWIQSRFQNGRPATLYFDEIRTPTYTDCLNGVFESVLGSCLAGLHHAGGTRRLSLYEIAQIVNRVGGYDPNLLQGCWRREAGPIPPRAGNVTLDSSKLADALGRQPFDPWPLSDQWVPTNRAWHRNRNGAGSPQLLERVLYRNPGRLRRK